MGSIHHLQQDGKSVRRFRLATVGAALGLALVVGTASSGGAGPFQNGYYANSSIHTILYPDMQFNAANRDWSPWMNHTRTTDYDPTDIDTYRVTYHNQGTYVVDVSWFTANLTVPGSAACAGPATGWECHHWHVIFDSSVTDNATQEYVACQELGHTLGLGHNNDADTIVEHGSCLADDEDSYQPHPGGGDRFHLLQHDINHLNAGY